MDPLNLFPAVALIALALAARATLGSWLAPAAFFPLFWSVVVTASLPVADYPVWHVALWLIVLDLLLFLIGSIAARGGVRPTGRLERPAPRLHVTLPGLPVVVLVTCTLAMVYILFRERFAVTTLDTPPLWFQAFLAATYAAPIFGGMLYATSEQRRARIVGLLSMAPSAFFAVANLGRGPLLASVYFWLAGYWSLRVLRQRGRVPLLTWRTVIAGPVLAGALVFTGATIGSLRVVGLTDRTTIAERFRIYPTLLREVDRSQEWYGFRHAVFSHVYAFSVYLRRALESPPHPLYGLHTFSGPMELLGFHTRVPYDPFDVEPGVSSNVYSVFMPPIEDFGLFGSLLVFFLAGLIGGWGYKRVAAGDLRWVPILTMFYPHVLVLGGYFFAYNSMVLAHVSVGLYLTAVYRRSASGAVMPAAPAPRVGVPLRHRLFIR